MRLEPDFKQSLQKLAKRSEHRGRASRPENRGISTPAGVRQGKRFALEEVAHGGGQTN